MAEAAAGVFCLCVRRGLESSIAIDDVGMYLFPAVICQLDSVVWNYLVYASVLVALGLSMPYEDDKARFAHCEIESMIIFDCLVKLFIETWDVSCNTISKQKHLHMQCRFRNQIPSSSLTHQHFNLVRKSLHLQPALHHSPNT